jgi:hypothetical protein
MVLYDGGDRKGEESRCFMAISGQQKNPETRQSLRAQEQVLKKYNLMPQGESKKRALEGNIPNNHNSFAISSNSEICKLVNYMGVSILPYQFDVIDIMRDLEVARHALDKTKRVELKNSNDFIQEEKIDVESEIPLLGWKENDSNQSHIPSPIKKQEDKHPLLENSIRGPCVRRSKRTSPSVYRDKGGQGSSSSMAQQCKKCSLWKAYFGKFEG